MHAQIWNRDDYTQNLESKFQRQSSGATRILSSRREERREQAKSCQKHVRANSTMISFQIKPKGKTGGEEKQLAKGLKCADTDGTSVVVWERFTKKSNDEKR